MDLIKKIYKIGRGPSSSHTMGPSRAAKDFLLQLPDNLSFKIILYGSLAATGKGHLTDVALLKIFPTDRTTIEWQPQIFLPEHPNADGIFCI